jgi:RNA polymerase sigma-70 factor (ECF subfamily)
MKRSLVDGCGAQERAQFLETLRLDDLVLARACARGNESAWDRFLNLYREKLYSTAAAIAREEPAGRELADSLYADLFGMRIRGDGCRISKLDSYLGRGSLEGWLRTVLAQEYVNRLRHQRKLIAFDESIDIRAEDVRSTGPEPHNAEVAQATDAAFAALSSEERFLLAAYYLDGRTLAQIGSMLNVHESTISRRLEKITATLRKRIVARLCAAGISKRAAEEMLEVDVRDLGVDVRNRLAQERQV